ncbi:MAG: glycosyltransferase [Candidatus Moraniibacteriota bacterium]|nr:MAG: glycosyltransferase [Candidatus Moranbacteria bacterium]
MTSGIPDGKASESLILPSRLLNTTVLFLLAAPLVVILYGSFVFNPNNSDHTLLYVIQVIADAIAIMALLGLWVTVLLDVVTASHHRSQKVNSSNFLNVTKPTIDVFVTTAGEPIDVIKGTLMAAVKMDYPHRTFVLDDGRSKEVRVLASQLGIVYVERSNRQHAKAGNVNNGLRFSKADFFAIFDADQVPKKDFIVKLLPYMSNNKLAMVQSPQYFANTHSFIAAGTAQAQEVFYRYVSPAKNISNSAFCVGTNMIFRRAAIDQIGGIALNHSEDIWTSFKLHERGWHTIFVNEVLAVGMAPITIASYFKQQRRWAKGGIGMLFNQNPLYAKKLNLDQRLQYFISNTYFLVGFSILAYLLFPILYLLFGVKPLDTENGLVWALHYVPYFGLYYMLTWLFLGKLHIATLATALASFYPFILAFVSALFDTEQEWVATTARRSSEEALFKWIWPHVLLILLGLFSLFVGWYDPDNFWTTLFNSVWVILNTYLLFVFVTGEKRLVKQSTF